ncbi:hypothetical protein QMK19_36860 [Streptomyces sp. H10-C2]|uniref:MauE/DoxX family redox-associated membrane protein n=1 Tax=unclassified Streptomyces TaxID=2593676 RepID=UPI0024BBA8D9|nr:MULTISPECIES: MauE/DoxX family redox-associated membrane protein [unclassified Streptomyces]MDJ0346590.1 hypothetical protein [Streptomyces sp. PH10-H1]MDJ0375037.1 hypothetical protein [Streptomyces sp. H10-C2]
MNTTPVPGHTDEASGRAAALPRGSARSGLGGTVLRLVLGAVYTGMGVGQLVSFRHMPALLGAYELVTGAAATLAAALIAGELVSGVWFLARPRSRALAPVWAYVAVSVVWSVLAVQAFARGVSVPNCGCFGVYLSQRLSWFTLLQDALTLFYAVLLLRGVRRTPAARAEHEQRR